MKFAIIDTWGLLDKLPFTTVEAAQAYRKALNQKYNCIARFWVRSLP